MSCFSRIFNTSITRRYSSIMCYKNSNIRFISTSNKNDDTTTTVSPTITQEEKTTIPKKKKYFQDYGCGASSEKEEIFTMHAMGFLYITGGTLIFFYYLYRPTSTLHDWALREGYLELKRREQLGLPLIDPNYVDPSTIYLPSDEELGETEIII